MQGPRTGDVPDDGELPGRCGGCVLAWKEEDFSLVFYFVFVGYARDESGKMQEGSGLKVREGKVTLCLQLVHVGQGQGNQG